MKFFLSRAHFPVTTLGFGRRIGVWFQGCSIRCPGCISADTWTFGLGETTVESVCATIEPWIHQADGVTISGGEPFDQPEALLALLRWCRPRISGDILIFSGYAREHLESKLITLTSEQLVDVIISDPFAPAAGQTLALRGSDNQRVHLLSPLGHARYSELSTMRRDTTRPSLDVVLDGDTVWMAGIPAAEDLSRLERLLAEAGFAGSTTAERPSLLA